MADILSFRDLDASKVAMDLVLTTYALVSKLPASERFELCVQMRRAAVSVPSNVAEGQANGLGGRYLHHVRMALGSLAELETQVEVIRRLKLLPSGDLNEVDEQLPRVRQLLHGLARSIRRELLKKAALGPTGLIICWLLLWSTGS